MSKLLRNLILVVLILAAAVLCSACAMDKPAVTTADSTADSRQSDVPVSQNATSDTTVSADATTDATADSRETESPQVTAGTTEPPVTDPADNTADSQATLPSATGSEQTEATLPPPATSETRTTQPSGQNEEQMHKINSIGDLNQTSVRDSHADVYTHSSLEKNFRESNVLESADLMGTTNPMYPRVRKLADGSYYMICQTGQYGSNILFMKSSDGVHYEKPKIIFADEPILDGTDTRRYMTADAAVLDNGDILVIASFRAVKGYRTLVGENGLVSRRSTDGGKTWGRVNVIYKGTNWEPYVYQLQSGEVQVLFTSTAEKLYLYGYNDERVSSGVGMIRSMDNGETWTPDVKEPPYAPQMVMKQYTITRQSDGVKCFTDQMASAVELHNGTIAVAAESRLPGTGSGDIYKITVGVTEDNWAMPLGFDEAGPKTKAENMFLGAAPYLSQFESGETLLTYNHTYFYAKLGSPTALEFGEAIKTFDKSGFWGSFVIDGSHSALLVFPTTAKSMGSTSSFTSQVNVARFYLNHDVNAQRLTPTIGGCNEEWAGNTDALFIGSESQAQASFRFAYDDQYVYILVERLDESLATGDAVSLLLDDGSADGYYNLRVGLRGVEFIEHFDGKTRKAVENPDIRAAVYVDGTIDSFGDTDVGAIAEIQIPRSLVQIRDGRLLFAGSLTNRDKAGEKIVTDAFAGVDNSKKDTWLRVNIGG